MRPNLLKPKKHWGDKIQEIQIDGYKSQLNFDWKKILMTFLPHLRTNKISCNYEKRYRNYEKIKSLLRDNYLVITRKYLVNTRSFSHNYEIIIS